MTDPHPNDLMEFRQAPDAALRETYPPLPRRGGNPNAVAPEAVVAAVVAHLPGSVPLTPAQPDPVVPDDPEIAEYKAAGWL